jgi:twitching motility protein PilT
MTEVISEGEYYGMQTFDQALLKHVTEGNIDEQTAFETASSPHDFKLMLEAKGKRASGIEQVLSSNGDEGEPEQDPAETLLQ